MILTAHQPGYLPWLGLFHKIALADEYCIFDDVQYKVRGFDNRNRLKLAQGPIWLTVPVYRKNHYNIKLKDVQICYETPWRRKHWDTIRLAYQKAPYFYQYSSFFEWLYQQHWEYLTDLNESILMFLLDALAIRVKVHKASKIGLIGAKSDLVLDMCRKLKPDMYIFGSDGRKYADVDKFLQAGIDVYFQSYQHPVYKQLHGSFVSHLSVIDLLFNEGPASFDVLMAGNVRALASIP